MEYRKTSEVTGHLICNKITNAVANSYDSKIMKFSRSSPQNKSETITSENDKERYISPAERQKIIDNLILI